MSQKAHHATLASKPRRQNAWLLSVSSLILASLTAGAPATSYAQDDDDEIVVTGTLLRGVAPTGQDVIGVTREDVEAAGSFTSAELLATIPQTGLFNTLPAPGAGFGLPIVRPNIRGLGASGSSTTLILVNGQRMAGQGILQTTPDASVIPPAAIERVDIVTGGASAIYGADAVGGVVNFVTRDRFDGTEVTARYGVADPYQALDLGITHGFEWDGGTAMVSFSHTEHNELLGRDRDYRRFDFTGIGGPDNRAFNCNPGNIARNGEPTVSVATRTTPAQRCINDNASLYPDEERNSLIGSLRQEINDRTELAVTGYWSRRETTTFSNLPSTNLNIDNTNPYFDPVAAETAHSVQVNWQSAFGDSLQSPARFDSMAISPELRYTFDNDWQLRGSLNFAYSDNQNRDRQDLNPIALLNAQRGTTLATAINPYDLASNDPALLAAIRDYEFYAESQQRTTGARVIADGTWFQAPGGDARLALGAEYGEQEIEAHISRGRRGLNEEAAYADADRDVFSLFGEFFLPLVSESNAIPFIRELNLSIALRYDDYSDFGDTTNPRIGFSYRPIDDLLLRGNWGKSFVAPSLADTEEGAVDARWTSYRFGAFLLPPGTPATDFTRPTILLSGGSSLQPEESESYEFGFDWDVPFIEGLRLSSTYYHINYTNQIAVPAFGPTLYDQPQLDFLYTLYPTQAELEATIAALGPGLPFELFSNVADLYPPNVLVDQTPSIVIDFRRRNYSSVETWGLDGGLSYFHPTSWGSIFADVNATQVLGRSETPVAGAGAIDVLKNANSNTGSIFVNASVGFQYDAFTARAAVSHSPGYSLRGFPTIQTSVDDFTPVDLYFSYDFDQSSLIGDATVSLNINNVFEEDPSPRVTQTNGGNGQTLGRLVSVGIRKRF